MTRRIKYETDSGNIFFCEIDSSNSIDTIIGTIPTGQETENLTFTISKNNNEAGGSPRYARFARLVGTDDYTPAYLYKGGRQYKDVAIPTKAAFQNINPGKLGDAQATQFTHRGETYTCIDKVSERIK